MSEFLVKNTPDNRALSDIGSAIFVRRGGDTKYHLWLPATNLPATGSEPETMDTTVTTSRVKTSIPGRIDPGQKTITFMAHRDNWMILKRDHRKVLDFLHVNPDGTGFKFQAKVTSFQDETSVGGNLTGSAVLTVTSADELPIDNVADLLQESVTFVSAIPAIVSLKGTGKESINVDTDPADATISVTSDTEGVCTVKATGKVIEITGVAEGSALVKVTATQADCADGETYILVIVK